MISTDINTHTTSFKSTKYLRDYLGGNIIINNKFKKQQIINKIVRCFPCYSRESNMCCKQVTNSSLFASRKNKKLLTCSITLIAKANTPFNKRLNNHRSNVSYPNAIPVCRHFTQNNHQFNNRAKFTLIGTTTNRDKPTEVIQDNLKKHKNFCINTLKTLHRHSFKLILN